VVAVLGGALTACGAPENHSVADGTPAAVAQPAPASTKPSPKAMTSPKDKTTKKVLTEIRRIPFGQTTVEDASLAKGRTEIRTRGVRGTKRLTFEVTYAGGKQVSKRLIRTVVTRQPVTQVRAVGTRVEQPEPSGDCDPNYSGCVPVASDVDCAGGSGNGPEYVAGPITVIGTDVYDLDRDNDGVACED
jgi:hypothetical protein